jgi:hypothetical protein
MSFLEFWGERVDPGSVGTVAVGEEHEACQCRPLVWARFVFVVIGLPVLWFFAVPYVPLPTPQAWAAVVGGTLIYVALGYLVDPQPSMDNIGIAGGMIDHEWRYSDDVNRALLAAKVFLGPGRFVAESLADMMAVSKDSECQSGGRLSDEEANRL